LKAPLVHKIHNTQQNLAGGLCPLMQAYVH